MGNCLLMNRKAGKLPLIENVDGGDEFNNRQTNKPND
jgi:hypothetical protein